MRTKTALVQVPVSALRLSNFVLEDIELEKKSEFVVQCRARIVDHKEYALSIVSASARFDLQQP